MTIKKVALDYGHCLLGADTGARSQYGKEEVLTREIGRKVRYILQQNGVEVVETVYNNVFANVSDSLKYRYTVANKSKADLFVSIHLNCFNSNAHGTEILTHGAKHFVEADRVLSNIVNLGFANRGVKDGKGLAVIKNTYMTSMLIECCFIDNKEDMARLNTDKMAQAIAEGILGKKVEVDNGSNTTTDTINTQAIINQLYAVTCSLNQYASTVQDNQAILDNIKGLQGVINYLKSKQ